jgi:hypothetical protein
MCSIREKGIHLLFARNVPSNLWCTSKMIRTGKMYLKKAEVNPKLHIDMKNDVESLPMNSGPKRCAELVEV